MNKKKHAIFYIMKSVLITGASGGIGLATVKQFLSLGYEVYALDIKEIEPLDHCHFYQIDIRSKDSIEQAFEKIQSEQVKFDAIIHLAGIYDLNSLIEMSEEDFVRSYDINLFGVFRINKAFVPLLNKKGKVVITTSELAITDPLPFTGIYGITKAALDKYAYSLRMELQLLGHQVVVLRPGAIDTGLLNVSVTKLNEFKKNTELYKDNATKFDEIVNSVESKKIPPAKLAKKIGKIVEKKKPRFVYKINRNFLLKLLNALPNRFQTWVIKKILTKKVKEKKDGSN